MHPEVLAPPAVEKLLREVEHLMAHTTKKDIGVNEVFSHDIQRLHGSAVGFMDPTLFKGLCAKYKISDADCDLLFVQAGRRSVPHVPISSGSAFLPLGRKHGYTSSKGGVYRNMYYPGDRTHHLKYMHGYPGQFLYSFPRDMLLLAPREAEKFSTIVFSTPKVRKEDGTFNMLHFPDSLVSVAEKHATVIAI